MLDVGFSEILVIFVLALIVLGPEKLPRVASQVGRWIGRARGMARQFREQLEEEVNLEQARKVQAPTAPPQTPQVVTEAPATPQAETEPQPSYHQPSYPDTYSHAHPTDSLGRPLDSASDALSRTTQAVTSQASDPRGVADASVAETALDSRQQDWVGGLPAVPGAVTVPFSDAAPASRPAEAAAAALSAEAAPHSRPTDAAYAPGNERGT